MPVAPAYLTAPISFPRSANLPARVVNALAGQLRERGLPQLYVAACTRFGVLSVSYGVTVWTNGRMLWWRAGGEETTWPAGDAPGAARVLVTLATTAKDGPAPDGVLSAG